MQVRQPKNVIEVTQVFLQCCNGGAQSYESRRQAFTLCTKLLVGVVSLSIFGGNFALAKVYLGLISVCCSELRGVCFSEVRNVLVLW